MGHVDSGVHTAKNWIGGVNSVHFDEEGHGRKLYPAEAIALAGMDTTVHKKAAFYNNIRVPGKFFTVRAGKPIGVVGNKYRVVQDSEAFDILTGLVDSDEIEIECAFKQKGGAKTVVVARRPEHILIAGDTVTTYMVCVNTHDGSGQIELFTTPTRWGCDNVLRTAQLDAATSYKIRHTRSALERMQQAREALAVSFAYTDELSELAEDMATTSISDLEFDLFLKELFPKSKEEGTAVARALNKREGVRTLYMTAPNLQNHRGTRWGAWNAAVEWDQHVRRHGNPEVRFNNVMSTSGVSERALAILTETA